MNQEFIDAYHHLDFNNKRNELNRELLAIGEYIKVIQKNLGLVNEIEISNYNPKEDDVLSEDEFLTSTYQDVFNIERELITLAKMTEINEKEEMFE